MVYPFVLMVTGSFSSNIDKNEFRLMPSFLMDTEALYRKHIESKYNENLQEYLTINQSEVLNFSSITSPPVYENSLIIDWIKFNQTVELPTGWYLTALGPTQDGKIIQENELKIPFESRVTSASIAEKGQMVLVIEDANGQELWHISPSGSVQRKTRVIPSP